MQFAYCILHTVNLNADTIQYLVLAISTGIEAYVVARPLIILAQK